MNIIFMGTPEFAAVSLKEILNNSYNVNAVFTPIDKPKGRGYKLEESAVKKVALQHNLPVYQPKSLKENNVFSLIKKLAPDLIIVIAYGMVLPKEILDIPKYGAINVHASLLPKYRGAGPVQWSVINGEKYAGITTMFMDEGLDTGDIIIKEKLLIEKDETSGELMDRLAILGSQVLLKTLSMFKNNKLIKIPQNNNEATWAPMLSKEISFINFNKPAVEIHNLIRGINPWPVAKIHMGEKIMKIYKSKIVELSGEQGKPGEIIDDKNFIIACSIGSIQLIDVQLEGKKRMNSKDFLKGTTIKKGVIVG